MRDPIPVYVHLRRAKDLIDRDFAAPLDLAALAREAHSSRAHFSRSFKNAFGETPHTRHVRGSNLCHIGVVADRRPGRAIVVSVLDNLVKGASGQAVQNANLMLGLDETAGLLAAPLFP